MAPGIVQPVPVAVEEDQAPPPDLTPGIVKLVQFLAQALPDHEPPPPASPKAGTSGTLPRRNASLSEKDKRQILGEDSDVESDDDATYKPDQASDESDHQTTDASDEEKPPPKKARQVIELSKIKPSNTLVDQSLNNTYIPF